MITTRGIDFLPAQELDIQQRARKKDPNFVLSKIFPEYFQFIIGQDGFKIIIVNVEWVNNNLSVIFGHGGHGFAHEFIPLDEIWIADRHPVNCLCKNVGPDRKMSEEFSGRTVKHEIDEFWDMAKGIIYEVAHKNALDNERKRGVLNPYAEVE